VTLHTVLFSYTHYTLLESVVEIWFSILVRKLLRRASFSSKADLKTRILDFIDYFNRTMAKPFKWTYKGKLLVCIITSIVRTRLLYRYFTLYQLKIMVSGCEEPVQVSAERAEQRSWVTAHSSVLYCDPEQFSGAGGDTEGGETGTLCRQGSHTILIIQLTLSNHL